MSETEAEVPVTQIGYMPTLAAEDFARIPRGYAYAVTLAGGGPPQRFHDPRDLAALLEASSINLEPLSIEETRALGPYRPRFLVFSGAPVEAAPGDPRRATFAGVVRADAVVAIRYWSPLDEARSESAYEAADALMDALEQAVSGRFGVPAEDLEPPSETDEDAETDEPAPAASGERIVF